MENDSEAYEKKSAEFKRWLALYFIGKGNWKLTDKAIEEFGIDATPRQTMEFAEVCSDREREERTQYRVGLTTKEKKGIAYVKIAEMIEQGKVEELYDAGYLTNSKLSWKDGNIRIFVVKNLVKILDKDPRDLRVGDFNNNKLGGLFCNYYNSSPYEAVKKTFPEKNIQAWEMKTTPMGFYEKKENRIAVVKWLVEKLKKDPRDLTREGFDNNRLRGLLNTHYNGSSYKAANEAFPELNINPWEMAMTPMRFYEEKENRVAAVKWLIEEKLKKNPRDIIGEDFHNNRLGGLLGLHYGDSVYEAANEAFPELNINPWEMANTPRGFFDKKENRVAAVKWLVIEKLKKDPRDLTKEDFTGNRLGGLLANYDNSPYKAVKEAFPEMNIKPWEMIFTPREFYYQKQNRVAAVKELVEKLEKDPRDLTTEDFHSNRLRGLLDHYYNGSPYEAIKEVGLVGEDDEKYMRERGVFGNYRDILTKKEAREAARKIERNAQKKLPKRMVKGKRRLI